MAIAEGNASNQLDLSKTAVVMKPNQLRNYIVEQKVALSLICLDIQNGLGNIAQHQRRHNILTSIIAIAEGAVLNQLDISKTAVAMKPSRSIYRETVQT